MVIIERKYHEIRPLLESLRRTIVNFDATLQYTFNQKIEELILGGCECITKQIFNTNKLLLVGDFSVDSLLSILIALNQTDLALHTYLKLASNEIKNNIK
ncbi:hypothetical protein HZS_3891 [Henneguya salminicola]|nr:hypothetical protein HZS_3891 [Henneguya salminicola]